MLSGCGSSGSGSVAVAVRGRGGCLAVAWQWQWGAVAGVVVRHAELRLLVGIMEQRENVFKIKSYLSRGNKINLR